MYICILSKFFFCFQPVNEMASVLDTSQASFTSVKASSSHAAPQHELLQKIQLLEKEVIRIKLKSRQEGNAQMSHKSCDNRCDEVCG